MKKNLNIFSNGKLEIRDTKKYGKGVFAIEKIKKGEVIHIMGGEKILVGEVVKRVNSGKENIDDIFQIGKKTYIDLDEFSRNFNHSCDPKAGIRGKNKMFALKNIKKGDEVTFDYSSTIAPTKWRMKCSCGSKKCRKILGDVLTIPKNQIQKYKKFGALQDYMKNVLKNIKKDKNGNVILPRYEKVALDALNKII